VTNFTIAHQWEVAYMLFFQLFPKSMTLICHYTLLHYTTCIFGASHVNLNTDSLILSAETN